MTFMQLLKYFGISFYGSENASGEIPFEVVYMVQYRDGAIKIFAYVTGDEQAAFKDYKLIPERLIPESVEYGKQD